MEKKANSQKLRYDHDEYTLKDNKKNYKLTR